MSRIQSCLCLFVILGLAAGLRAAEYTWDGSTDQNWDASTRWGGGSPWANAGDTGTVHAGRVLTTTTAFQGELRINAGGALRIASSTTTYTAGNLVLNGGTIWKQDSSPTPTLAGSLTVSSASRMRTPSGTVGQTTIAATISGSGGLARDAGAGRFVIQADNSGFSGDWTVSAGDLAFAHDRAPGSGTVTVGSGGRLWVSGGITITNRVTVESGGVFSPDSGTMTLENLILEGGEIERVSTAGKILNGAIHVLADSGISAQNTTVGASFVGSAGMIRRSGYALVLSGDNSLFTGAWRVEGAQALVVNSDAALGAGSYLLADSGAILRLNAQRDWTLPNHLSGVGKVGVGNDGSAGAADRTLTVQAATLTPGVSGAAGVLTIENSRYFADANRRAHATFAKAGDEWAKVHIAVTGGGAVAGMDYGQLRVTKGNISGLANATLEVRIAESLRTADLEGDVLTVVETLDGSLSGTFNQVTFEPSGWRGNVVYGGQTVTVRDLQRAATASVFRFQ